MDDLTSSPGSPPLSNAAAWLAAIVDSSDDAIIGKTLDSIIRSWNRGATRLFGYTAEEAVGRSVLMLIPPELQDEELGIIARVLGREPISHFETVRLRKDGTRIEVSLSVSPICDASGAIVGAAKIARDITESNRLRRAERELNEQLQQQTGELEQQVEEAQALQEELEQTNEQLHAALASAQSARRQAEDASRAKSQFLAVMSHELRTPLNAIAGYVDLLQMEIRGPLNETQRHDLARVKRSGESLLRLINDVLNLAKLEAGRVTYRLTNVRLGEILHALQGFVEPHLARKRIGYHVDPCGADLAVRADRDKVEQIMFNLLSNAVKFTDAGRIDVRCVVHGGTVHVEVADTGRGIRDDLTETIFEPFVQGERELTRTVEGTGLGLSISRELARAMGGDVLVRSALGSGSTFTLVLPRASDAR